MKNLVWPIKPLVRLAQKARTAQKALWCATALACVFLQPLQAQPESEQYSVTGAGLSVATSIYPLALIANDILAGHGNAVALIVAGARRITQRSAHRHASKRLGLTCSCGLAKTSRLPLSHYSAKTRAR